jgi:hypothetical protein
VGLYISQIVLKIPDPVGVFPNLVLLEKPVKLITGIEAKE